MTSTPRRLPRFARPVALLAGMVVVASLVASPAGVAATKKKTTTKPKVAAGQTCSPLGARAAGTSLDCVKVGAKLQWQPKGTKLNPFKIGETFEWTQSSNQRNAGALMSTRRISVAEYLPDASGWVSQWADNAPQDIFNAAKGLAVRGVKLNYTLVSATDASSRNLGSLTTFWLGDDKDAGCCSQGTLQWGSNPPREALDAYTSLADGESRTGVAVFARATESLGSRPLLRLAWLDADTGNNRFVYFDLLPQ